MTRKGRYQCSLGRLLVCSGLTSFAVAAPSVMFRSWSPLAAPSNVPSGSFGELGFWASASVMCFFLGAAFGVLFRGGRDALCGAVVGLALCPTTIVLVAIWNLTASLVS